MDVSLKDQAFGMIQRARLSEFFKAADETNGGCFYRSLANAYHFLNPGQMLPRNFETEVLRRNPSVTVPANELISRIKELQGILHLELSEVILFPHTRDSVAQARIKLHVPEEIPITKIGKLSYKDEGNCASLIWWEGEQINDEGHASSMEKAKILWGEADGSFGGQEEVRLAEKKGLIPMFVLNLKKWNPVLDNK